MAKGGESRSSSRGRKATAAKGRRGSKNYQPARAGTGIYSQASINAAAGQAGVAKKTEGFSYKGKTAKADKIVAGGNVLDAKGKKIKRLSFKEHIAQSGSRANDPRNWEFHYKAPKRKGTYTRGKNDQVRSYHGDAKRKAQSAAKRSGKEIYQVQEIEYNTQGITESSDTAVAASKAKGGGFGSTRVASNVALQKQKATRRGQAATSAFGADKPKRGAIA